MRAAVLMILCLAAALAGLWLALARGWTVARQDLQTLAARLEPHLLHYAPEADGSRPAVLILPGCGGVSAADRFWAQALSAAGIHAAILDSYAPRGLSRRAGLLLVCTGLLLWGQERAGDVLAGLSILRGKAGIDGTRLGVLGLSHGGWALLEALQERRPFNLVQRPEHALRGVQKAVLLYPYCGFAASARARLEDPPPLFAILAGEDSVVGAEPCLAAFARLRAAGASIDVHVYPDADHAFDEPEDPPFRHLPFRPDITADARARVLAAFSEAFR